MAETTICLRFAKATHEDVAAVQTIGLILEDLERGDYPRGADGKHVDGDPEWFDVDDAADCRVALQRLLEVVGRIPGGFMRISGLAHIALNNDVFDPDQDHLVWHPDLAPAVEERRRGRIIEAAANNPSIQWLDHQGNVIVSAAGCQIRHYCTGAPQHGWVLGTRGGGDRSRPVLPPEPGMEPVYVNGAHRWVHFGDGKEASHG